MGLSAPHNEPLKKKIEMLQLSTAPASCLSWRSVFFFLGSTLINANIYVSLKALMFRQISVAWKLTALLNHRGKSELNFCQFISVPICSLTRGLKEWCKSSPTAERVSLFDAEHFLLIVFFQGKIIYQVIDHLNWLVAMIWLRMYSQLRYPTTVLNSLEANLEG